MSEGDVLPRVPRRGELIAGKYELGEQLGAGAMGVVLSALHRDLGQSVAIKFMSPARGGSTQARARFVREARAVASLESEHVVRVLDFGTLDDRTPYMVMQYLKGFDLLSEARRCGGKLPQIDAVDYVVQACVGLAEAHARGIVHRDIKPGNLFLTRRANGEPLIKVLDFGISKAVEEDEGQPSLTETDSVLGSPQYMSPEQVRQAKTVDHRSDIWSLGVVLYHLLAGESPFNATGASGVVAAIVADEPVSLGKRDPTLPRELVAAVSRCLEKAPAFRFQSALELARALAPFGSKRAKLSLAQLEAASHSVGAIAVASESTYENTIGSSSSASWRPLAQSAEETVAPSVIERELVPPRTRRIVMIAGAGFAAVLAVGLLMPRSSDHTVTDVPRVASAPNSAEPMALKPAPNAEPIATSAPAVTQAAAPSPRPAPAHVTRPVFAAVTAITAKPVSAPAPAAVVPSPPAVARFPTKRRSADPLDGHD